jgi:cbb3-type cytochrome oxidase maturation protein
MESLYLLIPLSIALVFLIGIVFWRAVEGGQFEDLEGPAHHILMDDDDPIPHPQPFSRGEKGDKTPLPAGEGQGSGAVGEGIPSSPSGYWV